MIRASIVRSPIDVGAIRADVAGPSNGAIALFLGTVRAENDGRDVDGIEYSAYDEMAVSEMTAILEEARASFAVADAVVEHRLGELAVGEVSIAVAVAAPHRAAAFDAVQFIVNETKRRAPVWKLEHYADGTREWVGAAREAVA